ncbi:MAG TPA: glycerate kinase [Trichocoleus sp.]|jgi:D-glycerate 3-kinase
MKVAQILTDWVNGKELSSAAKAQLASQRLFDQHHARAWRTTPETVHQTIEQQLVLLRSIYPALAQFCINRLGWQDCPLNLLWELWLPLAEQIADWHQPLQKPLIQGILGGQGTGKTTLAAVLTQILGFLGLRVCRLSLDDLYKTYADRLSLQQFDSRYRWRGPPGTHDVELGLSVLQQLHNAAPTVLIPRFDKSAYGGAGDRTVSETITQVDIVLFEGWFVGVRPIDPATFDHAPPPILTANDRQFARDMNAKLQDYVPLWEQLDRLIVLYPTNYRLSQTWRKEAEQQMKLTGRSGMNDQEVDEFVNYFWQALHPDLFITPMLKDKQVDLVIELDVHHLPIQIYRPDAVETDQSN